MVKITAKYMMVATTSWQYLDEVTKYTEDDYYTVIAPVWESDATVLLNCQSDDEELMKKQCIEKTKASHKQHLDHGWWLDSYTDYSYIETDKLTERDLKDGWI